MHVLRKRPLFSEIAPTFARQDSQLVTAAEIYDSNADALWWKSPFTLLISRRAGIRLALITWNINYYTDQDI